MIDLGSPWEDAAISRRFPGVTLYRDASEHDLVYAVAAAPAFERNRAGKAACDLIFHGRQSEGRFEVSGGMISMTTVLCVEEVERRKVERFLSERAAPPVRVQSPQWKSGSVRVTLGEAPSLEGQPSLFGRNICALQASLARDDAEALRTAWANSDLAGSITYTVKAAGRPGSYRREISETEVMADDERSGRSMDHIARRPAGSPESLTLVRKLVPSDFSGRVREFDLGGDR